MNKITKAFENKKALITFITGGDPDIQTTKNLIIAMAEAGADIIEIGIPFSDPVAEGIIIQEADERALSNGCTVDKLFEMIKSVRESVNIPLLFMTYMNPVFVYGKEKFMQNCKLVGIDGVIIPDLPFEERFEIADECKKYDITLISLIAPTSSDRAELIAKYAEGLLYCVSSLGVTGTRKKIDSGINKIIEDVKKVSNIPCAIGFGISTPEQAREMAEISDGIIIGSAIVKLIAQYERNCIGPVKLFITKIKNILQKI